MVTAATPLILHIQCYAAFCSDCSRADILLVKNIVEEWEKVKEYCKRAKNCGQ